MLLFAISNKQSDNQCNMLNSKEREVSSLMIKWESWLLILCATCVLFPRQRYEESFFSLEWLPNTQETRVRVRNWWKKL